MRQKKHHRRVLVARKLRREREMSQAELGRRVGLTKSAIQAIEAGKRQPSFEKAKAIAAEFGRTVDEVFDYTELAS